MTNGLPSKPSPVVFGLVMLGMFSTVTALVWFAVS
jgi:hypothetical protein